MSTGKRFNIWAVLAGCLVDHVCTFVIILGYVVGCGVHLLSQGVPEAELSGRLVRLASSPMVLTAGGFCTVLGGFITGWIAKRDHVQHALMMGLLMLLTGALLTLGGPACAQLSPVISVVCLAITVPLAVLGGYLSRVLGAPGPQAR